MEINLMDTEFELSSKETIYMSIVWVLRHVFKSNYSNMEKTKYTIDTFEDYVLAAKIASMASKCNHRYPKVEKYKIETFSDICRLGVEVMRYEYTNKIYWLNSDDRSGIVMWRNHTKYVNTHGFWYELHFRILVEFIR